MRKLIAIVLAVSLVLTLGIGSGLALADKPEDVIVTSNGAPSGPHYNLNIIGVKYPKNINTDETQANGHVIFVNLNGHSKIRLVEGDDYAVLDKNATDGDGALLQLPDPGLDPYLVGDTEGKDTISDYSVFVRPLGKPDGWATITTCAELVDSDFAGLLSGKFLRTLNRAGEFGGLASVEQVGQDITFRTKGKSTFTNVTAELLTIVFKVEVDISAEGEDPEIIVEYVRVPIFDPIIENEYWEYDNKKLKLLQVRFYPVRTDVSAGDEDLPPLE